MLLIFFQQVSRLLQWKCLTGHAVKIHQFGLVLKWCWMFWMKHDGDWILLQVIRLEEKQMVAIIFKLLHHVTRRVFFLRIEHKLTPRLCTFRLNYPITCLLFFDLNLCLLLGCWLQHPALHSLHPHGSIRLWTDASHRRSHPHRHIFCISIILLQNKNEIMMR